MTGSLSCAEWHEKLIKRSNNGRFCLDFENLSVAADHSLVNTAHTERRGKTSFKEEEEEEEEEKEKDKKKRQKKHI